MKEVDDDTGVFNFTRGNKIFELSNHLGNVLATISDKKVPVDDGTYAHNSSMGLQEKVNSTLDGVLDYYNADVVTANDYYPFGMILPGRKFTQEVFIGMVLMGRNWTKKQLPQPHTITGSGFTALHLAVSYQLTH